MNPMFASGPFENPWLVLIFVVVGLISNWLMKRQQKDQAPPQPPVKPVTPSSSQSQDDFDLEAMLKRLLGEEQHTPPAPPVITALPPIKPVVIETAQEVTTTPPPLPMQRNLTATPSVLEREPASVSEAVRQYEDAARQIAALGEAKPQLVTPSRLPRRPRISRGHPAVALRTRQQARQAFITSLVFSPPKAFEI